MATRQASSRSDNNDYYCKLNFNLEAIKPFIECKQLISDNESLFWVDDYESLKSFTETVGLTGKWSPPGGRIKKFVADNADLTIMWHYGKQGSMLLRGGGAEKCKETLINMLKSPSDRSNIMESNNVSPTMDFTADSAKVSDASQLIDTSLSNTYAHECKCFDNGVEIDGVKLDIVIMQRKLEFVNGKISEIENCGSQTGVEKSAASKYSDILDEKNGQIERQLCMIESLQQKLTDVQKERDFLKTALFKSISGGCTNNKTAEKIHKSEVMPKTSDNDVDCIVQSPIVNIGWNNDLLNNNQKINEPFIPTNDKNLNNNATYKNTAVKLIFDEGVNGNQPSNYGDKQHDDLHIINTTDILSNHKYPNRETTKPQQKNPGNDYIKSIPVRITDRSPFRSNRGESFQARRKYVNRFAHNDHRTNSRASGSRDELLNTTYSKESNEFFRKARIRKPKPRLSQKLTRDKMLFYRFQY